MTQRAIARARGRSSRRGRRAPLTRDRVLESGVRLADLDGIETVTMRRVAHELGVEAMSLYNHVASKDDLLRGLVDMVIGEFELARPDASWKANLRRMAMSAHASLVRHAWAAPLVLSHTDRSDARLRYMDSMLATLRRAGFSAGQTDQAYHVLDSHIIGFSLWVGGMGIGKREDIVTLAAAFVARVRDMELPFLEEHIEQHINPDDPNAKSPFEFGLDLLLDGLERMIEPGPALSAG